MSLQVTTNSLQVDVGSTKWAAQVHQNGGGDTFGHGLVWGDQNLDLIADHLTVQTNDASLITTLTLTGSVTAGDVVGLDWTVNSVLYQIRYTVQVADTLSTIATNLVTGTPTLSAAQGSLYLRSDGSTTSTRAYINTNGSTGWTAITTAA